MTARSEPTPVPVEIEGGDFGIAQITGDIFRQAARKNPQQAARIRGSLALRGTDHPFETTIYFERERIRVTASADEKAGVLIEAPVMALARLGGGGHPVRAWLRRELKVRRMLRHPLLLMRVRRLTAAL